jgi:hypothetical protein
MAPQAPIDAGGIYTYPLQPQIRHVGRNNCPICGMTLERRLLGTISFAEALPSDKGTPSERSVIIYESANGGGKQAKNAIHPHR